MDQQLDVERSEARPERVDIGWWSVTGRPRLGVVGEHLDGRRTQGPGMLGGPEQPVPDGHMGTDAPAGEAGARHGGVDVDGRCGRLDPPHDHDLGTFPWPIPALDGCERPPDHGRP